MISKVNVNGYAYNIIGKPTPYTLWGSYRQEEKLLQKLEVAKTIDMSRKAKTVYDGTSQMRNVSSKE